MFEEYARKILSGEIKIDDIEQSKLNSIIIETKDLYYNSGSSYVTDEEYDTLEAMLQSISMNTVSVGSPVRGGKIELPNIMGSLDQNYIGDTSKWISNNNLKTDFVLGDKQDGVSGSATYENGILKISYSRGDGGEGADTTRHLLKMKKAIKSFKGSGILDVRYEVILNEDDFQNYKNHLISIGASKIPSNARNYTAGQMNAEVGEDWFYDNARVIVTSIYDAEFTLNKEDEYKYISSLGFDVTPYKVVGYKDITDEFLEKYLKERKTASKTEIDGIVLDVNDKTIRKNMKWKENSINPPFSRKFKLNDDGFDVKVVCVHWNPSKTGLLKPRVEIEPVDIKGVIVTYATGFNAKFIVNNGIGKGAIVNIVRSGDVIPFIRSCVTPAIPDLPEDYDYHWNDNGVEIILDDMDIKNVKVNRIVSTFSSLKIPMLKKASVEKLYDAGYDSLEKIIKMYKGQLQSVIGVSSGEKIYNGLKDKLNPISLYELAGASNLFGRGIGVRVMKKVADQLGEDAILNPKTTVNDLVSCDGIGDIMGMTIKLNQQKFIDFVSEIDGYVTFGDTSTKVTSNTLSGVKVVFTGVRDKDLEQKIISKGGEIIDKVKPGCYLVCKDKTKTSSKLTEASKVLSSDHILTIDEARNNWGG